MVEVSGKLVDTLPHDDVEMGFAQPVDLFLDEWLWFFCMSCMCISGKNTFRSGYFLFLDVFLDVANSIASIGIKNNCLLRNHF